jgi:hypothetical protein
MKYPYFRGLEADRYSFYRVPKALIKVDLFEKMSGDAKLLYAVLLDRMNLSLKNGWQDENGNAYIICTIDEIMDSIRCARQKAVKLLDELEHEYQLIERRRQGLGKPNLLYVKDLYAGLSESNYWKYENQTSGGLKSELPGVWKSNGSKTDINNTDAIISKGEFQQVQQLLELDTRTAPSQTTVYPLSGFLRCADCGQNMIRRTVTKNGKKYQYYHCSTYKNGGGCTPHMINSEKLTESVLAAIRHQVTLLVEAEKVLSNAELASGEQIGIKILDSQITALEAELERYSNLKIRLYQDLCDDVVSREEYGEMNTRFAQKIKEAQDKIQEIREKKQEALKHDTLLPTWLEEFKQYEHIKTLERRVVVELIDHIDVHSKTEIEIHFCFEDELHSITEKFMEYQAHHGNEVAEE